MADRSSGQDLRAVLRAGGAMEPGIAHSDYAAITPADDVNSLTAVLFECLTGFPPHQVDPVNSAVQAHVLNPVPVPRLQHPGVPSGFDQVIAHGLAKIPGQGFSTAGQLARSARSALEGTQVVLSKPDPVGPPPPTTTVAVADIEPKPPGSGPGSVGAQSKSRIRNLIEWIVVLVAAGITVFLGWYVDSTSSDGNSVDEPIVAVSTARLPTVVPGQTGPPPGAWICPSIYEPAGTLTHSAIDTTATSCLFAEEVRRAYGLPDPLGVPRMITLTSRPGPPVSMVCTTASNRVTCEGVDEVVYLF